MLFDILSAFAAMLVASMTPIPTEVPALAIALRFNFWTAIAIIWAGAMTGAAACHLLAARLGVGGTAWLMRRTWVREARDRLAGTGWLGIFGLRLTPLVPYFALSVAAGLLRLPLGPFLAGTALGILPATFTIAALGEGLIERDAGTIIGGALAFAALVLLGVLLRRRA